MYDHAEWTETASHFDPLTDCRSRDRSRVRTRVADRPIRAAHSTLLGSPQKAPRFFLVINNAAFATPSMEKEAALPQICPGRTPARLQWAGW